jgi:MarR family transcriptional regulator, 2-MHQ and catechol-resistance regulon repressor
MTPDTRSASPDKPAPAGSPKLRADPRLERDAAELRAALSQLIRVYQFRDRHWICGHELSVTQCHALEVIAEAGPLSMNELAGRLFLDKSTTSRVVDALERKSYAVRQANPNDGRALWLRATVDGARLVERIRREILADEKRLCAEFEPGVRREMTRLITRLARSAAARVDTSGGTCCSIG